MVNGDTQGEVKDQGNTANPSDGKEEMCDTASDPTKKPTKEVVAAIGGSSKRKLVKAIGASERDSGDQEDGPVKVKVDKKPLKKGKKVKLSFDEEAQEELSMR